MISMHRIPCSYDMDLSEGEEGNDSICKGRYYRENESGYR